MKAEMIPFLIVAVVGLAGGTLINIAFVLIVIKGGVRKALRRTADGRIPLAARCMLTDASLGVITCLATFFVLFSREWPFR
jgi:hypothetical protein